MKAQEARTILNKSNKYLTETLSTVFSNVRSQSEQGLNWTHVNLSMNDTAEFYDRVRSELVLLGYDVKEFNFSHNFTIKW